MANFYRIGAGGLDWKNTGSWSSTSGGASNGIDEPTSSDAVIFDASSPATCTITTIANCSTFTANKTSLVITLNGANLVLASGLTITLSVTFTKTASEIVEINGLTANATAGGTAPLYLKSGTWSGSGTVVFLYLDGNITVSGTVNSTGYLEYLSGAITTTGSTLRNDASNTTIKTPPNTAVFPDPPNGVDWDTFLCYRLNQNSGGLTITAPLKCNTFTASGGVGPSVTGSSVNRIIVTTNFNNALGSCFGTALIEVRAGSISGSITNPLELNGNIDIISLNCYSLYYISGTITVSATSITINMGAGTTLNTGPIQFNNVTVIAANQNVGATVLLSDMYITGTLTTSNSFCNFSGAYSIYINGLNSSSVGIGGSMTLVFTGGTWSGGNTVTCNVRFEGGANTITISGSIAFNSYGITYVSGTMITTNSTLNIVSYPVSYLDTGGMVWGNIYMGSWVNQNVSTIVPINSDLRCSGVLTVGGLYPVNINSGVGAVVRSSGGIAINVSMGGVKVILTGGTWSGTNTTGIANDLTIRPDNSNVTVSGTVYYRTGILLYTASTYNVVTTSSRLQMTGSGSLNTDGMSWNEISIFSGTTTLLSNAHLNGIFFYTGTGSPVLNRTTAETLTCNGLTVNRNGSGTAEIIIEGGTWSSNGSRLTNNLTINGNVTVSGTVAYGSGTLSYDDTGGPYTVTTTNSTLSIELGSTLDTAGISWNIVNFAAGTSLQVNVINSLLTANTLNLGSGSRTLQGTAGFLVNTLIHQGTTVDTVSLTNNITYTVTELFSAYTTRVGNILLFTSNHASLRANILMPNNGNNLCNVLASFTRIDASGGRSINTFGGTITDCVNVNQYYDYKTIAI